MANKHTSRSRRSGHGAVQRRTRSGSTVQAPKTPGKEKPATALTTPGSEGTLPALYQVQPADTPESIAGRFGVTLDLLVAVNPEIGKLNRVYPGEVVQIPLTPPVLPLNTRVATEYVTQEGDTLFSIAQRFQVSPTLLQRVNPLVTPDRIFAGEILLLPTVGEPPPSSVPGLLYVVQPGDTPAMVSGLFGITPMALTAANPQRVNPSQLYAGEVIVVPVAGIPSTRVFDRVRYIVQSMDSIEEIAKQFEVWLPGIGRLNPIVAAIPGLVLQLPESIPVPAPPKAPAGALAPLPAPFGRQLMLGDDDTVFVPFPADFRFSFYGQVRADGVWVNSNGNVTFGEGDPMFFPTTDAFLEGPPRIAPFWADLVPPAAVGTGGVYVDFFFDPNASGTRLAVTWDRVPILGIERFNTFQILLNQDGTIELGYFSVPPLPPEGERPRILIGLAPGGNNAGGNVFLYTGENNQRRVGDSAEPVPAHNLSGRVIVYRFVPAQGGYEMRYS